MVNFREKRYFRMIFLYFFMVTLLAVLMLLGVIMYQYWKQNLLLAKKSAENTMEQLAQVMDEKINQIDLFATQLKSDKWIRYASSNSLVLRDKIDMIKREEICGQLGDMEDIFRLCESAAVLVPGQDLCIDRYSFWEMDRYFNSIGLYSGIYTDLEHEMQGKYTTLYMYSNDKIRKERDNFIIARRLEYEDTLRRQLFVYMDGNAVKKYLMEYEPELLELKIVQDGQVIYHLSNEKKKARENIVQTIASRYLWEYEISLSEPTVTLPWMPIIVLSVIGGAVVAFGGAYGFAVLLYRPVIQLMKNLGMHQGTPRDELEEISSSFKKLSDEKENMEELANQYYMVGQNNFLASLLYGSFDTHKVEENSRKYFLGMNNEKGYMVALITKDPASEDKKQAMDIVIRLELHCCRNGCQVALYQENEMYYLIIYGNMDEAQLMDQRKKLGMFLDNMEEGGGVEIKIGYPYAGFGGIHLSWKDIQEEKGSESFYCPLELEIKLVNLITMESFNGAREILAQLKRENCSRQLSAAEIRKWGNILLSDFMRTPMGQRMDLRKQKVNEMMIGNMDRLDTLWGLLEELLSSFENRYFSDHNIKSLGVEIVEYVKQNFTDSALSQQGIADLFKISRPTVSKVFKATTNMNFVEYLHRLRVKQAKLLLDQGDRVETTIKRCGYENEITMKRAFVKYEGITPREYVRRKKEPPIAP
ncbi:MAG: helix-turn-helix domain-containing protein [Eubacteriales bacterium]|nr:helix-turn-helix domain-containing protein [Eubacteriales bacterium]